MPLLRLLSCSLLLLAACTVDDLPSPPGGGGGSPPCETLADCGSPGPCLKYTCSKGICGTIFLDAGVVIPTAIPCQSWRCDGHGRLVGTIDDKDTQSGSGAGVCDVPGCLNGFATFSSRATTDACGAAGGTCSVKGLCSQCAKDSDCGTSTACIQWHCRSDNVCELLLADHGIVAVPPSPGDCRHFVCTGGGFLVDDSKCPSRVCNGDGTCCDCSVCTTSPGCLCTNGARDVASHETDVDCGGFYCKPCGTGKACLFESDCASGFCDGGHCT